MHSITDEHQILTFLPSYTTERPSQHFTLTIFFCLQLITDLSIWKPYTWEKGCLVVKTDHLNSGGWHEWMYLKLMVYMKRSHTRYTSFPKIIARQHIAQTMFVFTLFKIQYTYTCSLKPDNYTIHAISIRKIFKKQNFEVYNVSFITA